MGTPQPGNYTRNGIVREATSPSAAVKLTRDGWVPTKKAASSKPAADSPKPTKPAEN